MHTRPRQRKERPPPMQHRDSRCKSKAILNQALSTWCLCEQHSPRAWTIPQVTRSTDVPAIHLLSQKAWTRKPLFFEKKTKTKISQSTPEKTASRTWNVTRMGFQLKHGKPLVSVTAVTLDSAPSFVLGRAKQKRRADKQGEASFNKNSLLKKRKIEHSRFLFTIIPPPPQFHLTLGCTFYFVFQVTFQEKVFFFFFSLSNTSQFLEIAQHLNHKPYPTRS